MFVYRLSTSSAIRKVCGGDVVCARVCKMSRELSTKDGTDFIKGCRRLSMCADAVCVGPEVHETMGRTFKGFL